MSDQETDKPALNNVLRQLDIKHLMAFEAIYSTRNISRAGQSLKFSQPTMSNLLARLRVTLDDPLFLRQPRGVLPSMRAEELIGPIRRVLREIERIAQPATSFDPERDTREFRLHALDIFESILIPPLIRRVQAHKGVTFKMLLPAKYPILEALESGEADLALGVSPTNQPDLRWEDLTPTELYVIARKGHPRIDGAVTLTDLQECSHAVMDMSPGALANSHLFTLANRLERHDAVRVTRPSSVIEIVANTGDPNAKEPVIYKLDFKRISAKTAFWAGRPAMRVVQALSWFRDDRASLDAAVNGIVRRLSSAPEREAIVQDLNQNIQAVPAWMYPVIEKITRTLSADEGSDDASQPSDTTRAHAESLR